MNTVGPAITVGMMARAGAVPRERAIAAVRRQLGPEDELLTAVVGEGHPPAAVRNAIVGEASGEVVVFTGVDAVPVDGWLESIRDAFLDPGIDAVAGSVGPPSTGRNHSSRPGGRLRWTGHLVADYTVDEPAATSLARGDNCAVRRQMVRELGGFDEAFTANWPHEEVEFFTRLMKRGGRMRYVPEARLLPEAEPDSGGERQSEDEALEAEVRRSRSMAAVFARHEAWALLILVASHLLIAIIEVFSSRLPRSAPIRITRGIMEGVRIGVRPVVSPFTVGKGAVR
jgi:GT2 family glycosyltransferase